MMLGLLLFVFVHVGSVQSMFLWQARDEQGFSCCLHYADQDICNPHVACSGHIESDLLGLQDYLDRLLHLEKIEQSSSFRLLQQARTVIGSLLKANVRLNYVLDYIQPVTFLHQVFDATRSTEKAAKSSPAPTAVDKQKVLDDALLKYLTKLGLAWPVKN